MLYVLCENMLLSDVCCDLSLMGCIFTKPIIPWYPSCASGYPNNASLFWFVSSTVDQATAFSIICQMLHIQLDYFANNNIIIDTFIELLLSHCFNSQTRNRLNTQNYKF